MELTPTPINAVTGLEKAKTDADGKPASVIIQQLYVRPPVRQPMDLAWWRNVNRAAEALIPRRVQLYDMYIDILLDGHLRSVVESRLMSVTNVKWVFKDKDGKEVDIIKRWIDTPAFEMTVREILNAKMWGYTMLEYDFTQMGLAVHLIPRKHMRPEQGAISNQQTANFDLNIREGIYADTILEAGDEKDLGLLLIAAYYVILKRGSVSDWAQFAEVFGQPLVDAVWDGYDENQRVMLQEAIDNMGSGGKIVRPAGTSIDFKNGGSNNPDGSLYKGIVDFCNAELSKLILGQTETTESSDSSGYAQASVHADKENDINVSDRNFVRRILNTRLLRILEAHGVATEGGCFDIQYDEGIDKKSRLDMDTKLRNEVGLPITDDYFYETYNIPKPENYDQLKQMQAQPLTMKQLLELKERGFFRKAPIVGGAKIISLAEFYSTATSCPICGGVPHTPDMITLSDEDDREFMDKVFKGLLKPGQINLSYYFQVAGRLTQAIGSAIFKSSKKELNVMDTKTQLFDRMRNNIFAFSGAKSLVALQEYSSQLYDADGKKKSYGAFRNDVTPIGKEFNDNYLKTEADSAHAMAQMADKWNSIKDYPRVEFRTAGDKRVRPAHAAIDGVTLRTEDPLLAVMWPPFDWGCRCTAIPAPRRPEQGRDLAVTFSKTIKPYFRRNSGMEQVAFHDDHPYFTRTAHDLKKGEQHQFMAQENYGMRPVEKIMLDGDLPVLDIPVDKEAAQKAWLTAPKQIKTPDGIAFDIEDRWQHVVEEHPDQDRWKYIGKAHEVLGDPDEVWSSREKQPDGSYQLLKRYVKYYQGRPLIFSYKNGDSKNWTMYKADPDSTGTYKRMRDNIRRGQLLYRK